MVSFCFMVFAVFKGHTIRYFIFAQKHILWAMSFMHAYQAFIDPPLNVVCRIYFLVVFNIRAHVIRHLLQ